MTSVSAPTIPADMNMPLRIASPCFRPNAIEMNDPVPSDSPIITDVRNVMRVYDDPTAARALSPMYFPTTQVSARL